MDDEHTKAIRLLKQARDRLAQRLAERVLIEQDDVLEDAEGRSYMDEIDTIYKQLGRRLHRVNQMLEDLTASRSDATQRVPVLALPAPGPRDGPSNLAPVSLQTVAAQLQAGRRDDAARLLASIFGLNIEQGSRCADHFAGRVSERPDLLLRTMKLRPAIQAQRYNDVLALLRDCFGLKMPESVQVLHNLRIRFGRDNSTKK